MTGPEVLKIIEDAIHSECGGDACGAEEFHTETAQAVLEALSSFDLLKIDG